MAQEQASKRSVAAYRGWAELYDDITTDFWYYRLRSPAAVANVLGQLRPGGHVAAIGGKWAPPWMPTLNLAVFALHWPWVTTFEGFERPWSHIEQWVADLRVETLAGGAGFVAWGTVPR